MRALNRSGMLAALLVAGLALAAGPLHPAAAAELVVAQETGETGEGGDPAGGQESSEQQEGQDPAGGGQSDPEAEVGTEEGQTEEGAEETGPPWTYQMARIVIALLIGLALGIGYLYYRFVVTRQRGAI